MYSEYSDMYNDSIQMNCYIADKFDQFWTTNRRLMERTNDEPFRHIPFKIYQVRLLHLLLENSVGGGKLLQYCDILRHQFVEAI